MANDGIIKESLRRQEVIVSSGTVTEVFFENEPNILLTKNNTSDYAYFGFTPNVSPTNYDGVISAGFIKKYVDPVGFTHIYFYTVDTGSLSIKSMMSYENYASELSESVIEIINASSVASNIAVADGADVSLGAKSDVAKTDSTTSGSLISFLKGVVSLIYNRLPSALTSGGGVKVGLSDSIPTGSNVVGGVTIADGSDATQGAKTDSANIDETSSGSVISFLKGILKTLKASIPAGSNVIGGVTIADGSAVTLGTTTDVKIAYSSAGTVISALKGIIYEVNTLYNWVISNLVMSGTSVAIKTTTMTLANTEYSYSFTGNVRKFSVFVEGGVSTDSFYIAFATGKVTSGADRIKINAVGGYSEDNIKLTSSDKIYFACSSAGQVATVIAWYN